MTTLLLAGGWSVSFNGLLSEELLTSEIFYSLAETIVLIEVWRRCHKHRAAWQQPGLPSTGPGSRDTAIPGLRIRFAPPSIGNGGRGHDALTS